VLFLLRNQTTKNNKAASRITGMIGVLLFCLGELLCGAFGGWDIGSTGIGAVRRTSEIDLAEGSVIPFLRDAETMSFS
jgi:hypothetical protein